VAEQQRACVGRGCHLGRQILDLVRSDRVVELDDQQGDRSELVEASSVPPMVARRGRS
jgi:hypothetical protein